MRCQGTDECQTDLVGAVRQGALRHTDQQRVLSTLSVDFVVGLHHLQQEANEQHKLQQTLNILPTAIRSSKEKFETEV